MLLQPVINYPLHMNMAPYIACVVECYAWIQHTDVHYVKWQESDRVVNKREAGGVDLAYLYLAHSSLTTIGIAGEELQSLSANWVSMTSVDSHQSLHTE